ncbi:MAG: hypothetical protein NXI23_25740 [Bacteroidetes bacterium]|jgi:hypothetical protein|nr:hypothetical protein [Bacteroidota bacterium]MDF1865978.1 hypothetical protein [Saprospiraceae bacterium]
MTNRQFYVQLGSLTIAIFILMAGLHFIPVLKPYWDITIGSIILFIVISVLIWHVGQNAALSDNKNIFTSLILGFIFGKMFLCVIFVLIYSKTVLPETKYFLVPFFIIYLAYTVFETMILTKLARLKPK